MQTGGHFGFGIYEGKDRKSLKLSLIIISTVDALALYLLQIKILPVYLLIRFASVREVDIAKTILRFVVCRLLLLLCL